MADTRTALDRLRVDVDPTRLRPADAVRRRADRQRRRRGVAAAAMAVAVVVGGSALLPRGPGAGAPVAPDTGAPTEIGTESPSPAPTATPSDPPLPLLPEPWTLTTSRATTLPAGGRAGDDLCGIGASRLDWLPGPKPVELQVFENGDTTLQVWAYTEGAGTASVSAANLFKAFFAGCGGPGVVESTEGPTNYWRVPGSPARMASLWVDDPTVYVIRMTSRESDPPDLVELVGIIDERYQR